MTIVRETILYDGPGGPFEGVMAYDDAATAPRPGVMVLPNILGLKDFDIAKAEALAALGYVGFAADVYGQGKRTTRGSPDIAVYMNELDADRALLRDRLSASLATLKAQPQVDAARTAAIGFCFGGKCVLDMARSGLDVRGVVSVHGVYDRPDYQNVAEMTARIMVCHGWNDPLGPPDAVVALAAELSAGKADWQLHAHGNAGHSFTDKDSAGGNPHFSYHEPTDRRSWTAMEDFLAEVLA